MPVSYYDYQELRERALNGTQENINNLGEWFEQYGSQYWNGECYKADGFNLYPVHKEISKEQFDIIGYEIK